MLRAGRIARGRLESSAVRRPRPVRQLTQDTTPPPLMPGLGQSRNTLQLHTAQTSNYKTIIAVTAFKTEIISIINNSHTDRYNDNDFRDEIKLLVFLFRNEVDQF